MKFTRRRARSGRGRLTRMLAAVGTSLLLAGGVLASPALASGPFTTHILPENTGYLALDVSGASTSPGASVIDWWSDAESSENWTFEPIFAPANIYEIVNDNSGQCLTTDGVAGHQLFQLPCNGNASNQEWITKLQAPPNNGNGYAIKSVATDLYLDVSGDGPWPGASIDTWSWNGGYNQGFTTLL